MKALEAVCAMCGKTEPMQVIESSPRDLPHFCMPEFWDVYYACADLPKRTLLLMCGSECWYRYFHEENASRSIGKFLSAMRPVARPEPKM